MQQPPIYFSFHNPPADAAAGDAEAKEPPLPERQQREKQEDVHDERSGSAARGRGARGFFPIPNAFEVFGFDFLVEEDYSIRLLEVNEGPALEGHFDAALCSRIVEDTLALVLDPWLPSVQGQRVVGSKAVDGVARFSPPLVCPCAAHVDGQVPRESIRHIVAPWVEGETRNDGHTRGYHNVRQFGCFACRVTRPL